MNLTLIDIFFVGHLKISDVIASVGVTILLVAFLLNLYTSLNFIGAAMCCFSSYLIKFYPFVVLEGVWATFALISLINVPRGTSDKG